MNYSKTPRIDIQHAEALIVKDYNLHSTELLLLLLFDEIYTITNRKIINYDLINKFAIMERATFNINKHKLLTKKHLIQKKTGKFILSESGQRIVNTYKAELQRLISLQ